MGQLPHLCQGSLEDAPDSGDAGHSLVRYVVRRRSLPARANEPAQGPGQTPLREVWGYDYDGGSNIVDSVIRSLRKKLGNQASAIETVRGFGYRSHL